MQQVRLLAAAPLLGTASVAINNTVLYLAQAVGSGVGSVLFARGELISMGFVALAFVAASFGVLWFTRLTPERVGIGFDSETIQLLARAFDQALDRYSVDVPLARFEPTLRAELARYIVAEAQTGERDEDRLAKKACLSLMGGLARYSDQRRHVQHTRWTRVTTCLDTGRRTFLRQP
jgi:hypothetical protein